MINSYTRVQTALTRFVMEGEGLSLAWISFNRQIQVYPPTLQTENFLASLAEYTALAGEPACLEDALAALEAQDRSPETARRVLLITGASTRQGACQIREQGGQFLDPIDLLIIANALEDSYQDLADASGGQARLANVNTIEGRANEIKNLWLQPVFLLRGEAPPGLILARGRGTLELSLSDGTFLELPLNFRGAEGQLSPSATPAPSLTPSAELALIQISPSPTLSPSPTQTASLSPSPSPSPTQTASLSPSPSPSPTQTASLSPSPSPSPTASPSLVPNPPPKEAESPTGDSLVWFILGGLVIGAGLILGLGYFLWPLAKRPASSEPGADLSSAPTLVQQAGIDFYTSGGLYQTAPPPAPSAAIPAPPPPQARRSPEDELLITEVMSDLDLQAWLKKSEGEGLGLVRHLTTPPQDYPLKPGIEISIGRKATCSISIPQDSVLSEEHLRIEARPDGSVWASVLSRTNPVIISGQLLRHGQSLALRPQDILKLSPQTQLIFVQGSPQAPDDEGVTQL
jgi:hypothetical protein